MKQLTCDSQHSWSAQTSRDPVVLRCWRRAGVCDGDHFAVVPNLNKEVRTKPHVVTWD